MFHVKHIGQHIEDDATLIIVHQNVSHETFILMLTNLIYECRLISRVHILERQDYITMATKSTKKAVTKTTTKSTTATKATAKTSNKNATTKTVTKSATKEVKPATKDTVKAAAKETKEIKEVKPAPAKKAASKFGLGKGMGALIPTSEPIVAAPKEEKPVKETVIVNAETMVNINMIEPNPNQPRKKFDEDALGELAESIKLHGLIQPILVQKKDMMYQIIAGERRWRACRLAKLKEVPVIVKELSENEQYEVALIENIQREDLNDIEEAYAYKALIEEFNLKQDEVAERVSKSRVAVTNSLRLLKLDNRVQNLVVNGLITGGHARALLGITDGNLQYDTATRIIDEKLSVRETEKLVKQLNNHTEKIVRKRSADSDAVYSQYEENLRSILGSRVEIKQNGQNKGKIVIEFSSADEFEKIFDIIKR